MLLSAGADRDLRDADGKTAAHASAEAGRDDCARALAVEMGSTKVAFLLLFRPVVFGWWS